MPRLLALTLALTLPLTLAPAIAHAGPADELEGSVGLDAPTGVLGFDFDHRFTRAVELDLGAGLAPGGPQLAAMPRLRADHGALSLAFGVGVSGGAYVRRPAICFWPPCSEGSALALWSNAEATVQVHSSGGWTSRVFLGVGVLTAHSTPEGARAAEIVTGLAVPYGGFGIGHTL